MDHKTFLFFDCECANCFDGIGKICSLGYVLCDDEFNVIEKDDIVMNPETEFDWYLFSPKNKCQLAYSKDYFRAKPNFESYYKRIKKLFSNGNTYVAGFAVENDVGFVNSACERYYKDLIMYRAFDVQNLLNQTFDTKKKLFEWAEFLECDLSQLESHKSVDDAMATMLVFKKVCEQKGKTAEEMMKENKGLFVSVEQVAQQMEERQYKKEMMTKIKAFYTKRSPNPIRKTYVGQKFELNKTVFTDLDRALNLVKRIYDGGGVIYERLKGDGNIVFLEDNLESEKREAILKKGYKIIFAEEIERIVK
ncbi:exonuclease domain-containing protein [Treponema sp.]|uniref:exonuclease domain-containing protein n=1 Tax=Treponema sp. TaxID=166 RepID=UPI00298E4CAA|nr:exonuclease domain-containing protein [Treponema sp.]MCR5613888.1 hypothetical protein [Treponema sp.]